MQNPSTYPVTSLTSHAVEASNCYSLYAKAPEHMPGRNKTIGANQGAQSRNGNVQCQRA